jgi:NADP-dependent 3-hydroxy acid dehydrogenase YdfG
VHHAEQPDLIGAVVDLGPTPGAEDAEVLLLLLSASTHGGRFALRDGVCLSERHVRVSDLDAPPVLDTNGAYLITGGLGALGLAAARTLARWGARRIVLVGRRSPAANARATVDDLRATGVAVEIRALDVTAADALANLLAELEAKGWALAGIVHAAGVLDDGIIAGQTTERVRGVLAPKIAGAVNLHHLTRDRRLDLWISFSSIAAIGGGVGQGAYAAANAFVDALAEYRRQHGLPGCSIQWGPWTIGMGASIVRERLTSAGLRALSAEEGTSLLDAALSRNEPTLIAAAADWTRVTARQPDAGVARGAAPSGLSRLDEADANERRAILSAYVDRMVRAVLLLPAAEPRCAQQSLLDLGLEAISATRLRNRLAADTGIELPLDVLLSGASRDQVAEALGHRFCVSSMNVSGPPGPDDRNAIEEFVL